MGLSRFYIQLLVAILFSLSANAQWIPLPFGTGTPTVSAYTWDPLKKGTAMALSGGDLIATNTTSGVFAQVLGVRGATDTQRVYYECQVTWSGLAALVGWANTSTDLNLGTGFDVNSWGYATLSGTGRIFTGGVQVVGGLVGYTTGQTVMIAIDMKYGAVYVGAAGVWANSARPDTTTSSRLGAVITWTPDTRRYFPAVGRDANNVYTANFGTTPFLYTLPTGYTKMSDL